MGILIRGGHVVDASTGVDEVKDLYLENGMIEEIGNGLSPRREQDQVINAEGLLVLPGIVDLHVHFRDPGQTQKEDLETGTGAAAKGGVTTVVAMPNTTPVIDDPDRYRYVINKAEKVSGIHVIQAGALTRGMKGEVLSEIDAMAEAGMKVLSEDGKSVMNAGLTKKAYQKAADHKMVILDHCEDMTLRGDGCMNEDENSRRLGLPGIPNSTEDVITARDILLAKETGAQLHLCHVSTAAAAGMMQRLHREGETSITAEVCPHHLLLTSDDIPGDDPNYKMNPPLRTRQDVESLIAALTDGSISVISTDHAPHTGTDKAGSMRTAAFGIVGLETSFALIYTHFVEKGILTRLQLVEKMCLNPARVLGLSCGTIQTGHPADIMIADVSEEYMIDKNKFVSKGRNTPFDGWKVKGKVKYTICSGNIIYKEGSITV